MMTNYQLCHRLRQMVDEYERTLPYLQSAVDPAVLATITVIVQDNDGAIIRLTVGAECVIKDGR